MTTNYLPFLRREVVYLVGGARAYTRLPIFGSGAGKRVILGDVDIWGTWPASSINPILCRFGILGHKYMTEDFIGLSAYQNGHRPLCMTWKFPKPYRIFPGQKMRATYIRPSNSYSRARTVAVMFNGVRDTDSRPIMLYDSFDCGTRTSPVVGAVGEISLDKEAMNCPSDSSILLYSVTFSEWMKVAYDNTVLPQVQIYGPDDRKWIEVGMQNLPALSGFENFRIIEPAVAKILLGESNGWVLSPDQTFTVDFLSTDTTAAGHVFITLRGCVEVNQ